MCPVARHLGDHRGVLMPGRVWATAKATQQDGKMVKDTLGSHIPAMVMTMKLFWSWRSTEINTYEVNVSFESLPRTSDQVLYPFPSYRFIFINQIDS